ncbi:phosphatase PAP2 family protein [Streptomyces sp. NPDC048664]|uniref:phosphatase PAP2 family protein n=1 Tax=Streptomyces sp. NPDC048664 TaxID=3154505 RepID=UPI0034439037
MPASTTGRRPRVALRAAAAVVALGFLAALEACARHYGLPGPISGQLRELVAPPSSGFLLYAGLALTMVVLTWRERFIAAGAAIGLDLAIATVRWLAGIEVTGGHPFGNGALWVIVGLSVVAVTRRTGRERALLLKGVGLGLLLVAGRKTGDTWLLITSKTRPTVLDQYLATADHALGDPSWLMGRIVTASGPIGFGLLDIVYAQLAVAAVCVTLYQLRHVASARRFPRHHLVRTFLVIGLVGPAVYLVFPVVGPLYAFSTGAEHWASFPLWQQAPSTAHWAVGDLWPHTAPPAGIPHPMPFDALTPRNCMPSLHTAWAVAIFVHSRGGPRSLRFAGAFWLVATLTATLGFGMHYGVDLIAGVVFSLTVEAALRTYDHGWDRSGLALVAYGVTVFTALLLSYRFLSVQMAARPAVSGALLVLAMISVIYGYTRTVEAWKPGGVPAPRPEPQPELS